MWIGIEATKMQRQAFSRQKRGGRAIIMVAGPEARHFLHNLLTADIESLMPGEARYGALLSPQGKILHDLFVYDTGDGFLLDAARSQAGELIKRLSLYKLRAQVTVSPVVDLDVGVSPEPTGDCHYPDPRAAGLGYRLFAETDSLPPEDDSYDAARIAAGLADSDADLGSGALFPHEANFDQFGAVSFAKGCYIGQEVVSRMEHRGTARSRILPVRFAAAAPPSGSDVKAGEKSLGQLLGARGMMGLALIRLDRLAEASGPLLSETVSVEVLKPAFARYDVPGAKD